MYSSSCSPCNAIACLLRHLIGPVTGIIGMCKVWKGAAVGSWKIYTSQKNFVGMHHPLNNPYNVEHSSEKSHFPPTRAILWLWSLNFCCLSETLAVCSSLFSSSFMNFFLGAKSRIWELGSPCFPGPEQCLHHQFVAFSAPDMCCFILCWFPQGPSLGWRMMISTMCFTSCLYSLASVEFWSIAIHSWIVKGSRERWTPGYWYPLPSSCRPLTLLVTKSCSLPVPQFASSQLSFIGYFISSLRCVSRDDYLLLLVLLMLSIHNGYYFSLIPLNSTLAKQFLFTLLDSLPLSSWDLIFIFSFPA